MTPKTTRTHSFIFLLLWASIHPLLSQAVTFAVPEDPKVSNSHAPLFFLEIGAGVKTFVSTELNTAVANKVTQTNGTYSSNFVAAKFDDALIFPVTLGFQPHGTRFAISLSREYLRSTLDMTATTGSHRLYEFSLTHTEYRIGLYYHYLILDRITSFVMLSYSFGNSSLNESLSNGSATSTSSDYTASGSGYGVDVGTRYFFNQHFHFFLKGGLSTYRESSYSNALLNTSFNGVRVFGGPGFNF